MRLAAAISLTIFIASAIVLVTGAPMLHLIATRSMRTAHAAVADACAMAVAAAPRDRLAPELSALQARYNLEAIGIDLSGGAEASGSDVESRATPYGILRVHFREERLEQPMYVVRMATLAAALSGAAGTILLLMNVLAYARRERGAGGAPEPHSESSYLIETFQTSLKTMKGRESELRRLHDQEKERADELATISGTLVRSLASGFIAVDERGRVVEMNTAARELLRIERPQVAGEALEDVLGDSAFARTLGAAVGERTAIQRQEIAEEDGATIGLTTVPLLDPAQRYFGMLALFTDLTPMRRLEHQLREMQSLADLGEMSAGIAHEFRNSLSTIVGYLRLARRAASPAEAEERLGRADQEAKLLAASVESLLAFARPVGINTQPLDVAALTAELAGQLTEVRGIDVQLAGGSVMIDGDPLLLRRAFENLLRNAAEAIGGTGRGGHIVIEGRERPFPTITISDDGAGLDPAEDPARLFLPFRSTKPNGFGLGLALAKKVVLLHGGSIRLVPRGGGGATVTVEFPPPRAEA
jgi:signal transduction histidine kinase